MGRCLVSTDAETFHWKYADSLAQKPAGLLPLKSAPSPATPVPAEPRRAGRLTGSGGIVPAVVMEQPYEHIEQAPAAVVETHPIVPRIQPAGVGVWTRVAEGGVSGRSRGVDDATLVVLVLALVGLVLFGLGVPSLRWPLTWLMLRSNQNAAYRTMTSVPHRHSRLQ